MTDDTKAESQKRIKAFEKMALSWQKTDESLNNLEAEINALYDCLIDGLAILNTEGQVTRINKRLLDIGGYSEMEIIGKKLKDLHMFTQESISDMLEYFAKIIIEKNVPPFEVEAYTKTGEKRVFEIYSSLLEKLGEVMGVIVILRDVTAQKETEKKLRESEERIRALEEARPREPKA